ncbi:MAG TPA: PilZ domain-containing protein [Candidatus Polarisedimenticolia bacterium]|nr:PilZ domain-containing protein [Candidatus Polarisedimenticolia bacterium]
MAKDRLDVRLDPRVSTRVRVTVFGDPPGQREIAMTTRDLSAGGALCDSPHPLPLGRPVRMRLDLADDSGAPHPVVLKAIVLRVEGESPHVIAFHFVEVPARLLELIRRFVLSTLKRSGG